MNVKIVIAEADNWKYLKHTSFVYMLPVIKRFVDQECLHILVDNILVPERCNNRRRMGSPSAAFMYRLEFPHEQTGLFLLKSVSSIQKTVTVSVEVSITLFRWLRTVSKKWFICVYQLGHQLFYKDERITRHHIVAVVFSARIQ